MLLFLGLLILSFFATATPYLPYNERGIPLFYYDSRQGSDFKNFGDDLSLKIVERIVGHQVNTTLCNKLSKKNKRKLLALGSILINAETNDVIWGSGVNGKNLNKRSYQFKALDVRAVRGPLTRQFLMSLGIPCDEVYGDPALLLPILFPEFKKSQNPKNKYIIIPHYSDESLFTNDPHMVSVKEDPFHIIEQILDSQLVISTSLHGIIVAEAFGIAARYLKVSDFEPLFKYQDYYFGTCREDFKYALNLEEALAMGGESPPVCDLEKLLNAFPIELFPNSPFIKEIPKEVLQVP